MGSNRVCVSDRAIVACPPQIPAKALAGDPRDCKNNQDRGIGDSAYCLIHAAELAGFFALNAPHAVPILFGCLATTSAFTYTCTSGGTTTTPLRHATVTFTKGKTAWKTTTVLPTP
jgi:hypothetical protein